MQKNKQLTKLLASPPRTVNAPGTPTGTNVSGSPKPNLQGMGGANINSPVPNSLTSPRPASVPTPNMAMNQAGGALTTVSSNLSNASATMVSFSNTGNMQHAGNLMAGNNKAMMQNGPFSIASSMNTSMNNSIGRSTVTTTAMMGNNANQLLVGAGGMSNMQQQLNPQVMAKVRASCLLQVDFMVKY